MLGCHDFCGYYEWTFHYLRSRFGEAALAQYWAEAIAADSQQHYLDAARKEGLRGLHKTWAQTGVDEECDWTVTLDEPGNLLRLDMRECPSKGFLLGHDLNADEDYCDHCMGWIGPALYSIGAEVAAHEHNHCGQCWWEVRNRNEPQPPIEVSTDIRRDPRWGHGYLDRYSHHAKLPIVEGNGPVDSIELLRRWLPGSTRLIPVDVDANIPAANPAAAVLVSGRRYASGDCPTERVRGVLLDHDAEALAAVARVFHASERPPLLLHPYFPKQPKLDFAAHGLPRAVPILPLLIRTRVYRHRPGQTPPSFYELSKMLADALHLEITLTAPAKTSNPT